MVPIPTTHPDHCIDSISELPWLPHCEVEGIEAIPVLAPGHRQFEFPHSLVGFDKLENTTGDESALLHFFVADSRLSRLVRRPLHYIPRIAGYAAVTTPDFSLYRSMPPHRRVLSTALNRSFGVLFQSRGLGVFQSGLPVSMSTAKSRTSVPPGASSRKTLLWNVSPSRTCSATMWLKTRS